MLLKRVLLIAAAAALLTAPAMAAGDDASYAAPGQKMHRSQGHLGA
jgi:hypothetical protein